MKRRVLWTVGAALVAAVVLGGVREVRAQAGPGGGPLRHLAMQILPAARTFHQELDLSAEQREQLHRIIRCRWPEIQAALKAVKAAHKVVLDKSVATPVDEAAIKQAVADAEPVVAKAAVLRANVLHEVLAVLTPAQQQRAAAFRAQVSGILDNAIEHGPACVQ